MRKSIPRTCKVCLKKFNVSQVKLGSSRGSSRTGAKISTFTRSDEGVIWEDNVAFCTDCWKDLVVMLKEGMAKNMFEMLRKK